MPEPVEVPAAVMYRMGGRSYAAEVDASCRVCRSLYRSTVETMVVSGKTYAAIARTLPSDAELSPTQISRHVRGKHLPLAEEVRRQIVEDRAIELGIDPETHTGAGVADHLAMLRVGVNDVMERMIARDVEPTVREGIAMARILTKVDIHEEERADTSKLQMAAIRAILGLVRELMDDSSYRIFSARVVNDPAVMALMPKADEEDQPIEVGAHT